MNNPRYDAVIAAVHILEQPTMFSGEQAEANRLLARLTPIDCDRCDPTGHIQGKRKPNKCKRCHGVKRGYKFAEAIYWSGRPERDNR